MEWTEVKAKPKKKKAPKDDDDDSGYYGGATGNALKSGPVKQTGGGVAKPAANKQASAIADYDFIKDENEEIKYETVNHDCAIAVQNARMAKELTQAQLAKAINEKTSVVVDIENGTAVYNAEVINRIEKVLGVKIPRGRKNKKKKK